MINISIPVTKIYSENCYLDAGVKKMKKENQLV
jgi:hypothetical protein